MTDPIDALIAAADDGVAQDGLEVERTAEGYRLVTPARERTGLTRSALAAALRSLEAYPSNWRFWDMIPATRTGRRQFLRWCEGIDAHAGPLGDHYDSLAEGVTRTWGQLRVRTTLAADGPPGERRYAVCHVDDAAVDPDSLEAHTDPRTARTIARFDDGDRYRPLKSAPTLRRGWHFPDLEAPALLAVVDWIYPASITNWHRERRGSLDVDHWRPTAERQTGIFDIVEELPVEAVEWLAEACCVDSQCCKRREWEYDADESLPVEPGEGAFPCREPCSLAIAVARQCAIVEGESERSVSLQLSRSEANQLGAILEGAATRAESVTEGDVSDPRNRYRARFLHAKRFAEGLELDDG